jgi:hypothetical protein
MQLLFTSLEQSAGGGGGPTPPMPQDTVIDFVNSIYTVGATSYSLAATVNHPELVDASGLVIPPTQQTYAVRLLSPFDVVGRTDAFTAVVEFEVTQDADMSFSFAAMLLMCQTADANVDPGGDALSVWINVSGGQLQAASWLDNGDVYEAFTQDSFTAIPYTPYPTTHKIAVNFSLPELAISLDGQSVKLDAGDPLPRSLAAIQVLIGSSASATAWGGPVTWGPVTFRKIWFYATQRPNSALPTLST